MGCFPQKQILGPHFGRSFNQLLGLEPQKRYSEKRPPRKRTSLAGPLSDSISLITQKCIHYTVASVCAPRFAKFPSCSDKKHSVFRCYKMRYNKIFIEVQLSVVEMILCCYMTR